MKCVKCGQELESNSGFCGACGEPISQEKKFCGKCGQEVSKDSPFCGNCGNSLILQLTTVPVPTRTFGDVIQSIKEKSKALLPIIKKYRVAIIAVIVVILLGIGTYFGYQHFHDFTKLSWDESYGDYNVTYTSVSQIELKALAYDKNDTEIVDITYTVDQGEVEVDSDGAVWTLPTEAGTYTITASSPSGKKITHTVNVINLDGNDSTNLFVEVAEIEDDGDEDGDGLTNAQEEELKTNLYLADTDGDGLIDSYEIEIGTDPLKADSDNDGLTDGAEITLGMDPLKEDTKGDGVKDGDRTYTTNITENNVTVKLTGKGNVASPSVDIYTNTTLANTGGLLGKIYEFSTEGTVLNAEVTIPYSLEEIQTVGLSEDNLTLYYFDMETKELTPIETTVDKDKKTITVTLEHFSKYVVGDSKEVDLKSETQIQFVIDDSVSMYSEKQMTELGYDSSTGAVGNDTEFKRISLSQKLLDMLSGNYQFGVAEFSGTYYSYSDFTSDKDSVKESLDKIQDMEHNEDGTDIVNALEKGIASFDMDDNNHYLIMLTDGKDTSGKLNYKVDTIVSKAQEKNVKICVIGLGTVDKDNLKTIAEETGCGFYYATSSDVLDQVYQQLTADINYGLVDIDGDGNADGTVVYDSGFIPSRDGFSFKNYGIVGNEGGQCYGMASVANFFYRGVLPARLSALTEKQLFGIVGTYTSSGYSFPYNSYFRDFTNSLYDYEFDELKYVFDYDNITDYWDRVENGTLKINNTYRTILENLGIQIETKNYTKGDTDYTSIEKPLLDVESTSLDSSADDTNLFKAIWRLFIEQFNNKSVSFSTSPDKAFEYAITSLEEDNPIILSFHFQMNGENAGHAVNLIRIIEDLEDSNKFYFEVYDNNRPGVSKYFTVTRTKMNKIQLNYTAWVNDYQYSFEYPEYGYPVTSVYLEYLDY